MRVPRDQYGDWRAGWIIAAVFAGIALFCAILIFAVIKPLNEVACNQRVEELGVPEGDYRFMSSECWLELEDGSQIPASQYRAAEETGR